MAKTKIHLHTIRPYDLEGSLNKVVGLFSDFQIKYCNYDKLDIKYDSYGPDDYPVFYLNGTRDETPLEEAKREAGEKKQNEVTIEFKRHQYEALKKELGL